MAEFLVQVAVGVVAGYIYDLLKDLLKKITKQPPTEIRRRILASAVVCLATAVLLILSDFTPVRVGETVAVWILGRPDAEKLIAAAWKDFEQGRWTEAVPDTEKIIKRFRKVGGDIEHELEQAKAEAPPKGLRVGPSKTIEIMERDPLNFLATAYWIQAQAWEQLNEPEKARVAYCDCIALKYARNWDPHHWIIRGWSPYGEFWSQSERAEGDLADLARAKQLADSCDTKTGGS